MLFKVLVGGTIYLSKENIIILLSIGMQKATFPCIFANGIYYHSLLLLLT